MCQPLAFGNKTYIIGPGIFNKQFEGFLMVDPKIVLKKIEYNHNVCFAIQPVEDFAWSKFKLQKMQTLRNFQFSLKCALFWP